MNLNRQINIPGYQFQRSLGKGWFGHVYLMNHEALAVERAVKVIAKENVSDANNFHKEAQTLQSLRHDHIVGVYDAGITEEHVYIAMEYLPKGSASNLGTSSLTSAVDMIRDVSYGLEHAHNCYFVHRDIKPGNILIADNGTAKLSDFGLASRLSTQGVTSSSGYTAHKAPEMISDAVCTIHSDIYSLGITLYRLLNGDEFLPNVGSLLEKKITSGKFPDRTKYQPFVPRSLRIVINRSLNVDPSKRQQDVSTFRKQVQGCKIFFNWEIVSPGVEYIAEMNDVRYRICQTPCKKNSYCVELTKQTNGSLPRRVAKDCLEFSSEKEAVNHMLAVINRLSNTGA